MKINISQQERAALESLLKKVVQAAEQDRPTPRRAKALIGDVDGYIVDNGWDYAVLGASMKRVQGLTEQDVAGLRDYILDRQLDWMQDPPASTMMLCRNFDKLISSSRKWVDSGRMNILPGLKRV